MNDIKLDLRAVLRRPPDAEAKIKGSNEYSSVNGIVRFCQTPFGVVVATEIKGLPAPENHCASPIFGFHIHEGESCGGNADDPFAKTGTHFNPLNCRHPYHAGDLPSIFGCGGYAFSVFLTDRFTVSTIIGRTVVLHSSPDDFTTQPSGNSGKKIACGIIE